MQVKVFPANRALAREKVDLELVSTVARCGNRVFVEYYSSSNKGKSEVIIFQKDNDKLFAWHECPAEKSGYAKGCWHLGLAGWVFDLPEGVLDVELVCPPDQYWVSEDLTPMYLKKPGEFQTLALTPEREPVGTLSESETASLHEEDRFLVNKYHLPKPLIERLVPFRDHQKGRLSPEQKMRVPHDVNYMPQNSEVVYATAALLYDTWAPPLFIGPAGSGKSTLSEALAEILYLPLRRISGGIDVNAEYLLGSKTLAPVEEVGDTLAAKISLAAAKAGSPLTPEEFTVVQQKLKTGSMQVVHEPGVLLKAVTDGEMILVDEINMLVPEVTSILHSLLDWQRTITVSGVGEVKADPSFRLVAAMNVGYMGTRPLNQAFRDRFRGIQVPGISRETLKTLLLQWVDDTTADKLSDIYETLYQAVYSPVGATLSESCLSLRALLRAAEEFSIGIGTLQNITVSCLTESIESEQDRTQIKDLIEMKF